MVAILVLLTVIGFLTVDFIVQRAAAKRALLLGVGASVFRKVQVPLLSTVKSLFYDRAHSWMKIEDSGGIRVGIDAIPSAILGQIDSVQLQAAGTDVRKGEPLLTLTHGKRTLTIPAPVSGHIDTVNAQVSETPSALSRDPFGLGWVYQITPSKPGADFLNGKMFGTEALAWMRGELGRLRDFMAGAALTPATAGATLQDGGFPVAGIAEELTDEEWQKLTQEFFPSAV